MAVKLDKIQGIGKKLRNKIIDYFEDEETAIKALKSGMGGLITGISQKKAINFARTIFELEYSANIDKILKTEHIVSIYFEIIEFIKKYFITEYSKNKISLYFPLGPENIDLIKERYEIFGRALKFVQKYGNDLGNNGLMDNLNKLSLFKKDDSRNKIKSRCIVTDSRRIMDYLVEEEINKILLCELIDSEKIKDLDAYFKNFADTFETVLLITNNSSIAPELMNIIILDTNDISLETLVPEKTIQLFSSNKNIIDAIYKIAKLLLNIKDKPLITEFIDVLNLEKIEILQKNTEILDEKGNIILGYDKNLDIYRENAIKYNGIIIECENNINDSIKKEINSSSVTIEGEKILDLFRSNASIDNIRQYVPVEIDDLINEQIEVGIAEIEKTFHLSKKESNWLKNIYPEFIEIPVSLNPEALDQLEFNIKKRAAVYNYSLLRDIAHNLKENETYLNELIWIMLEFEFFYAIGRFSNDYQLKLPKIDINNHGIVINNSFNLNLKNKSLIEGEPTVPINYSVGNFVCEGANPSRLNLLSGSNSGGKTMCLVTLAHSLILAQMGFPCPGNVVYNPVSEIYFFKKSSGQISAGAFESTLLMFVELAQSPHEKIILADELEAITEPNAAAKVIGSIFSLLLENPNNYAVFVTHLIEMLLKNLSNEEKNHIRVDGIEAQGLNDDLELIIDRNPKFNYIARSTPELILERLSKKGIGNEKDFFEKILERFNRI